MRKMDVVALHSVFFKKHGFTLNQSQLLFERPFPHGKQVVSVHLIEESHECYLEYHLGIRITEVEEMIHQFLPTFSNNVEQSITLVQTPDKLGSSYPQRIKVSGAKHLSEVVDSVEKFFLTTGFIWLDKMIDPNMLEKEFLHHKENSFEGYNLIESAFRSTALSRLYNPIDYPALRQSFLEKINSYDMTPFTLASFLQFLFHLDKRKQVAA